MDSLILLLPESGGRRLTIAITSKGGTQMSGDVERNPSDKPLPVNDRYDVSIDVQKSILQMCWAQHDGQWFLKSKKRLGVEQANELNQEVLLSMARIEARHVLNALGIDKEAVKTIPDLFKVINTFLHVLVPAVMEFKMVPLSQHEGVGIVEKCYVWEAVKQSKGESEYTCACSIRHRGWLDAIGVSDKIVPVRRIPDGDDICEFRFTMER